MPENTDHPTQKPEKLAAKLILASSPPGGMVFDPFLGSGTTAVTAKKLGRHFAGIELNPDYCCWALERLARAEKHPVYLPPMDMQCDFSASMPFVANIKVRS